MKKLKQGVDYFPLNTDFIHDSVICRIMKRKGNSAFTILLYALSHIYSDKGYYVHTDNEFYDEFSDQLFDTDNDTVHCVLKLAAEYCFFDSDIYQRDMVTKASENETESPNSTIHSEVRKRGINEVLRKKSNLTQEDINRMQAPADGRLCNLSGLLDNLLLDRFSPSEQYAIISKIITEPSVVRYGKGLVISEILVGKSNCPVIIC